MGPYIAKSNGGMRIAVAVLEATSTCVAMPTFMKKGNKQMSIHDANMSRMVTKVRL